MFLAYTILGMSTYILFCILFSKAHSLLTISPSPLSVYLIPQTSPHPHDFVHADSPPRVLEFLLVPPGSLPSPF